MSRGISPQSIVSRVCPNFSHEVVMMRARLPPLNALKAFEASARHKSFTRAAEELCVTRGTVSHQVKALEAELAIKLFNRERQRLIITEAGRDYLSVLRDALDRIAVGTERLLQRQNAGVLKTYWIICPKATANQPKIVTFRNWLHSEAASDLRGLKLGAPK